jgi:hypothetical protein
MDSPALTEIQRTISQFAGYQSEEKRGVSDEQIRAFVGERLAAMPAAEVDSLSPEERATYDRVLLRCEFANQLALARFAHNPPPEAIARTVEADKEVIAAADDLDAKTGSSLHEALQRLDRAFDTRDAAMQGK